MHIALRYNVFLHVQRYLDTIQPPPTLAPATVALSALLPGTHLLYLGTSVANVDQCLAEDVSATPGI